MENGLKYIGTRIPESFLSGHGSLILSGDADLRSYYYTEFHREHTELHWVIEQMSKWFFFVTLWLKTMENIIWEQRLTIADFRRIARRASISIEKIIRQIFLLSVGHLHYVKWIEVICNADATDPFRKRGFKRI